MPSDGVAHNFTIVYAPKKDTKRLLSVWPFFSRCNDQERVAVHSAERDAMKLTVSILQAVAAQAQASPSTPATQTLTAPIHVISNPPSFHSFLKNHRAAVALFTDATCGPCRMIAPVYEKLSEEKGVKADGTDGKKLDELKGADANELRTQIYLLLYQAFPPHPHTSLSLPAVQALSLNPILFTQVPAIDTVLTKLSTFIDSTPWPPIPQTPAQVKETLTGTVAPYLKARFSKTTTTTLPSATPALLTSWSQATSALTTALPAASLFPLVDLWRLALLDPSVGTWSAPSSPSDPIHLFIDKAIAALRDPAENPRNYLLTVLRLLSNAFATPALAQQLLLTTREKLGAVLVPSLLPCTRTRRVGGGNDTSKRDGLEDEEWEVEMVSAVVEALERETTSEDVVHRLTASLAFLLRLSPAYEEQMAPLLEVLQARDVLRRKLGKGGCGEEGVRKKEVRRLVEEVADKLCPKAKSSKEKGGGTASFKFLRNLIERPKSASASAVPSNASRVSLSSGSGGQDLVPGNKVGTVEITAPGGNATSHQEAGSQTQGSDRKATVKDGLGVASRFAQTLLKRVAECVDTNPVKVAFSIA
ncbi:hypothetical protein FPV67DRAFT_1650326, partial [Lyophyllum atratum]